MLAAVARVLLAEGADAGLTNNQGNDSLDAANEARNLLGRPEVSELLLGHRRGDNPLETQPRVMPLRAPITWGGGPVRPCHCRGPGRGEAPR